MLLGHILEYANDMKYMNDNVLHFFKCETSLQRVGSAPYSPALSCCLVFFMYAENLEKISIPAVFDS